MSSMAQIPGPSDTVEVNQPSCDSTAVLDLLEDETSRRIVGLSDTPLTVSELADECDLPLSTVYRKVDRLESAGLLRESIRLSATGKHPSQYERAIDHVSISLDHGIQVSCFQG